MELTKQITFKVNSKDYSRLEQKAYINRMSMAKYCRSVLVENYQESNDLFRESNKRQMLSEITALCNLVNKYKVNYPQVDFEELERSVHGLWLWLK